jgi:hypothetical protein
VRDGAEVAAPDPLSVRAELSEEGQAMRIDHDRVVPFRHARAVQPASRLVHVDIEIDLIRQCREDWRRGETEIWRHVSLEADLRRDASGDLRLFGLPGHEDGVAVPPADLLADVTRFEEPGLCVSLSSAAIREAESALRPAAILPFPFARAG